MSKQAKIAIISSIVLHLLVLAILALVRSYAEIATESNLPVSIIKEKNENRPRRSTPIRPIASLDLSIKPRQFDQYVIRPPEYKASNEVFYARDFKDLSSPVRRLNQGSLHSRNLSQPMTELRQRLSKLISADVRRESELRAVLTQPKVFEGHDLISEIKFSKAKPEAILSSDALKSFAETVRRKIESNKKYPLSAQRMGLEGRIGIKMTILKDGQLSQVEIISSSGFDILDSAALQSVRDAAPFPPFPEEIRRDEIEMSVYLVFKIT